MIATLSEIHVPSVEHLNFSSSPIVPVVTIDELETAYPLMEALLSAGINIIEVTLRTPCALDAIREISTSFPEIVVGAGSIRAAEHVQQVVDAGAGFCVSPGITNGLLEAVSKQKIPLIPGASTPSEMMQLYEYGFRLIKFFPAELSGGIAMLKALSAPLPDIQFFPSGGITPALAPDYLALKNVVCIGGSWFVPSVKIKSKNFGWIEKSASAAIQLTVDPLNA